MDNFKGLISSSKRPIKRGPTPLAPSPSPSGARPMTEALRMKFIFGETPQQAGRDRTFA